MASVIKGEDVVLSMLISGVYYPFLCAEDCTFSREVEFVAITSPSSSQFSEIMPRKESWSMSVSGLTKIANDSVLTFFYILQTSVRRVKKTVRMSFTDEAGASKTISGDVYFGNMDINGPATDFAHANIEMRGTGAFTVGDTIDPVVTTETLYSDTWDFPAAATSLGGQSLGYSTGTLHDLQAVTILTVWRSGVEHNLVTTTPGNMEVKHNNTTGVLTFDASNPSNGETVFVLFKRIT